MKRLVLLACVLLAFALLPLGCGDGSPQTCANPPCGNPSKCSPACQTGQKCIEFDEGWLCKWSCTRQEDCFPTRTGQQGLACHLDHDVPFCGD